jgi:hypothetical protein
VDEGTRTPDRLDHNQELYQLSYVHQAPIKSSGWARIRGRVAYPRGRNQNDFLPAVMRSSVPGRREISERNARR